jgi:hypothetical protein
MQSQKNLLKISLVAVLLMLGVSGRPGAEAQPSQRVEFSGWDTSGSHPVVLAGEKHKQPFSPADASEDFVVVTISAGQWEDYVYTDSQSSTHESVDTVVQGSLIYNCAQGTVSGSVTAGLEHSVQLY